MAYAGVSMTSFVFVSHASPDKAAIRHVVDALIAAGLKVWLDDPAAMGYSADEVRANFYRLTASNRWQDEIDDAVLAASAVIVCFSRRFDEKRRHKWRDEAAIARANKNLVACRIDDVEPTSLINSYAEQQMPDVRASRPANELQTALGLLIDDVKRKMTERDEARVRSRSGSATPRDWFTPYLVDRADQEGEIGLALGEIVTDGGVRAFLVAGPENEGVDGFIDRLERRYCPETFGHSWRRLVVEWPSGHAHTETGKNFQSRLKKELRLPVSATPVQVVTSLAEFRRPVAVLSYVRAEAWRADECMSVRAWLRLWEEYDKAARAAGVKMAALPILCLKMPPAEPGWRGIPSGRAPGASLTNRQIWRNVCAIREPGFFMSWVYPPVTKPDFKAPPVLHPVTRGHVDTWLQHDSVRKQLGPDGHSDATGIMTRLFKTDRRNAGVAFDDFVKSLSPLFGGRA